MLGDHSMTRVSCVRCFCCCCRCGTWSSTPLAMQGWQRCWQHLATHSCTRCAARAGPGQFFSEAGWLALALSWWMALVCAGWDASCKLQMQHMLLCLAFDCLCPSCPRPSPCYSITWFCVLQVHTTYEDGVHAVLFSSVPDQDVKPEWVERARARTQSVSHSRHLRRSCFSEPSITDPVSIVCMVWALHMY